MVGEYLLGLVGIPKTYPLLFGVISTFISRHMTVTTFCCIDVQVATVTPEQLFHMLTKEELEEIIKKLPA